MDKEEQEINYDEKKPTLLQRLTQKVSETKKARRVYRDVLDCIVDENKYPLAVVQKVASEILRFQSRIISIQAKIFYIESQSDEKAFEDFWEFCKQSFEVCLFIKLSENWQFFCFKRQNEAVTMSIFGQKTNLKIIRVIEMLKKLNMDISTEKQMRCWTTSLNKNITDVLCLKTFEHFILSKMGISFPIQQISDEYQLAFSKSDLKFYVIQKLIKQKLAIFVYQKLQTSELQKNLEKIIQLKATFGQSTKALLRKIKEEDEKSQEGDHQPSADLIKEIDRNKQIAQKNYTHIKKLAVQQKEEKQKSSSDRAFQKLIEVIKIMKGVYYTKRSGDMLLKVSKVFNITLQILMEILTLPMQVHLQSKDQLQSGSPIPLKDILTVEKKNAEKSSLDRSEEQILTLVCSDFSPEIKNSFLDSFKQIKTHCQEWSKKTKQEVQSWASSHKGKPMTLPQKFQCIGVMNRAYQLITGFSLRATQIAAVLSLIVTEDKKGKLLQVETGEGKTTIVFLIVTIKALEGYSVDVITSNSVLAKQGVKSNQGLYNIFNLTVSHNNKQDVKDDSKELACYSANIVYGSISNFQFDHLNHEFEGNNKRGARKFEFSVLDEVDSLIIDNGRTVAKLSGPFYGMSYLKYIYINIWKAIVRAEQQETQQIYQKLESVSSQSKEATATTTKFQYENKKSYFELIDKSSQNIKSKVLKSSLIDFSMVPSYLVDYCKSMTENWVDSAMTARYKYQENEQYILKYDQKEKITKIVPVDYLNTGVTLHNTQWCKGLHQFLQLKHNIFLTNQSLTTCFISNLGYIKLYENRMYGMTGTLGSTAQKEFFKEIYSLQFGKIPNFRKKQLIRLENSLMTDSTWMEKVVTAIFEQIDHSRSVLVICKTINDLLILEKNVTLYRDMCSNKELVRIKIYKDESFSQITHEMVDTNQIILATNIAGRGTDFKTSQLLEHYGGLHVIVCFLPSNERVQYQAVGRTARQGNQGSAELIIKESDVQQIGISEEDAQKGLTFEGILSHRNDCQRIRLEKIRAEKISEITFKDSTFILFLKIVKTIREKIKKKKILQHLLQDLIQQWAFWLFELEEKEKNFANLKPQQEFDKFLAKEKVKESLSQKISFNFFNAISQADQFLMNPIDQSNIKSAKQSLQMGAKISSGQPNEGVKGALYLKFFEVSIQQGKQLMKRLKKALVKHFNINVDSKDDYKVNAKKYLESAKKSLEMEREFIVKKVIGEEQSEQSKKFREILIQIEEGKENQFLKHFSAKVNALNLVQNHINSLLTAFAQSKDDEGLIIYQRIPNYFRDLKPQTKEQKQICKAIGSIDFQELAEVGLQVTYGLKVVYDIPQAIIIAAQAQIGAGIALIGVAVAFPQSAAALMPAAGALISQGISDLIFQLLNQGESGFNMKQYLKGKLVSYAISLATFGLGAIATSMKIMSKAISICRKMAKLLRQSKKLKQLCTKMAVVFEKFGSSMSKMVNLAKIQKLSKAQKWRSTILKQALSSTASKTAGKIANHLIMTNMVEKILNYLLGLFSPLIQKKVQQIVEREISKDRLAVLSDDIFQESLQKAQEKSVGQEVKEVLRQIVVGMLQRGAHWSLKLVGSSIETIKIISEVTTCANEFCKTFNQLIKDHKQAEGQKKDVDQRINSIKQQLSQQIKALLHKLLSFYASEYLVGPALQKGKNLLGKIFKQKKGEQMKEVQKITNLSEIKKALDILQLKKYNPSIEEVNRAFKLLARRYHPDKNDGADAKQRFQEINNAHKLLKAFIMNQRETSNTAKTDDQFKGKDASSNGGKQLKDQKKMLSLEDIFNPKQRLSSKIKNNFKQRAIAGNLVGGGVDKTIKSKQTRKRPPILQFLNKHGKFLGEQQLKKHLQKGEQRYQQMPLGKALQNHVKQRFDRLANLANLIVFKGLHQKIRAEDGAQFQSDKFLYRPSRTVKISLYKTNTVQGLNQVDREKLISELSHKDGAHTLGFKLINVPKQFRDQFNSEVSFVNPMPKAGNISFERDIDRWQIKTLNEILGALTKQAGTNKQLRDSLNLIRLSRDPNVSNKAQLLKWIPMADQFLQKYIQKKITDSAPQLFKRFQKSQQKNKSSRQAKYILQQHINSKKFISNEGNGNCGINALNDMLKQYRSNKGIDDQQVITREQIAETSAKFVNLSSLYNQVNNREDLRRNIENDGQDVQTIQFNNNVARQMQSIFKDMKKLKDVVAMHLEDKKDSQGIQPEHRRRLTELQRKVQQTDSWQNLKELSGKIFLETSLFGIDTDHMRQFHGFKKNLPSLMKYKMRRDGVWLTGSQIKAQLLSEGFVFDRLDYMTGYPAGVIIQFRNKQGEIIQLHNNTRQSGDEGTHWQAVKREFND